MKRGAGLLMAIAVGISATPILALAEGDVTRGQALYAACQDCHGEKGEGSQDLNAPSLAGQHDWYLLSQLQNFRSGKRGQVAEDTFGQVMMEPAQDLADDQAMEDVVAYIATLEAIRPTRTESSGDPQRGADFYSICSSCHGSKAQGLPAAPTPDDFPGPRLTGQHDWYLIRQLEYFKNKIRGANLDDRPGLYMRTQILELQKGEDVRDVVAYIMTLQ